MKEEKVIELKNYLNKKIEPKNLMVEVQSPFSREKNLTKRSIAFAVDIFAIGLFKFATVWTYSKFLETFVGSLSFSQKYQLTKALSYFDVFLTFAIFVGYFTFCFYTLGGRTLGKKLTKLTTVTNDWIDIPEQTNFKMDFKSSLLRSCGYLASYASFGILFALPFVRRDHRSLSEIFSNTSVITKMDFHQIFLLKNNTQEVITIDTEVEKKVA